MGDVKVATVGVCSSSAVKHRVTQEAADEIHRGGDGAAAEPTNSRDRADEAAAAAPTESVATAIDPTAVEEDPAEAEQEEGEAKEDIEEVMPIDPTADATAGKETTGTDTMRDNAAAEEEPTTCLNGHLAADKEEEEMEELADAAVGDGAVVAPTPTATPAAATDPAPHAEVDEESVAVTDAPALGCGSTVHKKRTRSSAAAAAKPIDDDDVAGATSVEDVHSPEIICIDSDDNDTAHSESSVAVDETVAAPGGRGGRRKKRARVLGFSNNKVRGHKPKRLTIDSSTSAAASAAATAMAPPPPPTTTRGRGRPPKKSVELVATANSDAASQLLPPTATGTNEPAAAPWDWASCSVYFAPLAQANMDELATVRRECARVVAANGHLWGVMRRVEHDDAYLVNMVREAGDDLEPLRGRPMRRGRSFRDAWAEIDFLARQNEHQRQSNRPVTSNGKKRPFAGCDGVVSHRQLVWGYDDALFEAYTAKLERLVAAGSNTAAGDEDSSTSETLREPTRRWIHEPSPSPSRSTRKSKSKTKPLKPGKGAVLEPDMLPPLPVGALHPASCGAWKLKGRETPSFDAIHPAAIRSVAIPQRWIEERAQEGHGTADSGEVVAATALRRSGRHDAKQDDSAALDDSAAITTKQDEAKPLCEQPVSDEAVELRSFGVVVEEDEVSREIDNSLVRLVEVTALNWRRAQALYEHAVSFIEVSPLLEAKNAAQTRLEQLYAKLYPPGYSADDVDSGIQRKVTLERRPRDLIQFACEPCPTKAESTAVAASVEYAVRLKKGNPIDVLDRNGCWNDGVVDAVYDEGSADAKSVLVSFALWGGEGGEWVSTTDGRILPRGVADGRAVFTLPPTRTRKRAIVMNQSTADLLQTTYPSRQHTRRALQSQSESESSDSLKPLSKKQRKR